MILSIWVALVVECLTTVWRLFTSCSNLPTKPGTQWRAWMFYFLTQQESQFTILKKSKSKKEEKCSSNQAWNVNARVGVISNFDNRLHDILPNLGLKPFIDFIVTSEVLLFANNRLLPLLCLRGIYSGQPEKFFPPPHL